MGTVFSQLLMKGIITLLLFVVAVWCGVGIKNLWFSRAVVLRPFQYVQDGGANATMGEGFAQLVNHKIALLDDLYSVPIELSETNGQCKQPNASASDAESRNESSTGADAESSVLRVGLETRSTTGDLPGQQLQELLANVSLSQLPENYTPVLQDISLEVKGINLAQIFTAIERAVVRPNQISGSISERTASQSKGFSVSGELNTVLSFASLEPANWKFDDVTDKDEAATRLACAIYKHLASQKSVGESPFLSSFNDDDFFQYTKFRRSLRKYRNAQSRHDIVPDSVCKEWREAKRRFLAIKQTKPEFVLVRSISLIDSDRQEEAATELTALIASLPEGDKRITSLTAAIELLKKGPDASESASEVVKAGVRIRVDGLFGNIAIVMKSGNETLLVSTGAVFGKENAKVYMDDRHIADVIRSGSVGGLGFAKLIASAKSDLGPTKFDLLESNNATKEAFIAGKKTVVRSYRASIQVAELQSMVRDVAEFVSVDGSGFQEGVSGTPILNSDGVMLGIVFAASTDFRTVFGLPMNQVWQSLNSEYPDQKTLQKVAP